MKNHANDIIYLSNPEKVSMDDEWFDITNREHFWMKWRFGVFKRCFSVFNENNKKVKVFEIGCGNGINMQMMETELGLTSDGCDLNEKALHIIEGVSGKKYLYNIFDCNTIMLEKYDVVLLFDVLEHIDDDLKFLRATAKHLKPGGLLIINVPAHRLLYSVYDKQIGHVKRYGTKDMDELILKAGLKIESSQFWGLLLVPVLILRKLILLVFRKRVIATGFKLPNQFVNKFFLALMWLEQKLYPKPFVGTSLFYVAKKKL
ncbi:MAG: class I SAM-dependent methyltransferase [Bacteroidota bacterium]|nr:class I SAM-dependent methyltransferase [Bacteroidota bacterium]